MAKLLRKHKNDGEDRLSDTTQKGNGVSSHTLPRVSLSSDGYRDSISRSNSKKNRPSSVPRVNPNGSFNSSLVPQSTPILKSKSADENLPARSYLPGGVHLPPPAFPIQVDHPLPVREDTEVELAEGDLRNVPDGFTGPTKSDSNGFLSSLFNAAHNAATSMLAPQDEDGIQTPNGKSPADGAVNGLGPPQGANRSRKNTFSNRLELLLKPVKPPNATDLQDGSSETTEKNTDKHYFVSHDELTKESLSPTSTANVHFEPVRESPLNSLGAGDLTLDSFEQRLVKPLELAGVTTPGGGKDVLGSGSINPNNIHTLINGTPSMQSRKSDSVNRRLMITPNQSSDNLADPKRSLSPGVVNRALLSTSQLVVSGNADSKKVHRKGMGNNCITDLSKLRSQSFSRVKSEDGTDDESAISDIDSVNSGAKSPALSEIVDYSKIKFAPKKKNKEFHSAFKNVPHGDKLIEDCSCALSKDFLVQGRMYISEHYICFNSNILGWVTNLVIPLQEVIQIEKKSTAVLFPNGMIIRTLHHKYVFATFLSRDSTFTLITNIWHRVLVKSSDVDPAKLLQKVDSLSRKARRKRTSSATSNSDDRYDSGISDYSVDDLDSIEEASVDENAKKKAANDDSFSDDSSTSKKSIDNDIQDQDLDDGYQSEDGSFDEPDDIDEVAPAKKEKSSRGSQGADDSNFNGFALVGPTTHAPTSTNYTKDSSETFICEETLKGPLGAVFLLLFGNDTSNFIKVLKAQKNFDISESDITALSEKQKERHYTYIKPLGGPIGPKQTKCHIDDKLVEYLLDKYILIEQVTATPDVPSGNSFKVRTKIFLSWAPHNFTKVYVVTIVEWSGKSWIKGAIEKGSIDGQKESMKVLVEKVNEMLTNGNNSASSGKSKAKGKKKSRSRKNTISKKEKTSSDENSNQNASSPDNETISAQFTNLVSSIGKSIPVQIPFIGDFIVGLLVIFLGFALSRVLVNLVFGSLSPQFKIEGLSTGQVSHISINDDKYLVIPGIDTKLKSRRNKMETEVELWDWIKERSSNKMHIKSAGHEHAEMRDDKDVYHEYSQQEIREIIDVTKLKLEKLHERLGV